MKLNELRDNAGARKGRVRVGRGIGTLDQFDRTAGFLDRLASALRHSSNLERQLGL